MTKFSRLVPRRDRVVSSRSTTFIRGGLIALAIASTFVLVGCGGGGDAPGLVGDPPTIPPPPPPPPPPPVTPPPNLGAYQVVYGMTANSVPVRFTGTSCANLTIEKIKNQTLFPYDGALDYKMVWHEPLPSGRILMAFVSSYSGYATQHVGIIDPIANTVMDYDGSEGPPPRMTPTETEPIPDGWLRSSNSPIGEDPIGYFAITPGFMIYHDRVLGHIARCRDSVGDYEVKRLLDEGWIYFVGFTRP